MIQKNQVTAIFPLLTAFVSTILLFAQSGCSDSQEAAAVNRASESVDQGGRMILAAGQVNLQALQKNQADNAFGELENSIQELAGQLNELDGENDQDLLELTKSLNVLSGQLVAKQTEVNNSRPENLQRRLKRAQEMLEDASRSATGPVRVAPDLLLGTLHLTQARERREQLNEIKLAVQGQHIELLNLADQIITETGYRGGLPGQFPRDKMVTDLSKRIDSDTVASGEADSLEEQLLRSEEKIVELQKRQEQSRKRVREFQEIVREKHAKYIALLERAKNVRGDQRYALQNEAYAVRSGIDSEGQGLSFYDALAESEQYNLDRTEVLLKIEEIRRNQLQKQLAAIRQSITDLTESPINGDIEAGIESSGKRLEDLVLQALSVMEKLDEAEANYFAARKEVVTAYRDAKKSYKKAKSSAGRNSDAGSYAESMVQCVSSDLSNAAFSYDDPATYKTETAGLWQEEAYFYDALAELTGVLASLPALQEVAGEYRDAYAGKADQARQSMQDETPESNGH